MLLPLGSELLFSTIVARNLMKEPVSEGERLKGIGFQLWKSRMGDHKEIKVLCIFSTLTQGNPDELAHAFPLTSQPGLQGRKVQDGDYDSL